MGNKNIGRSVTFAAVLLLVLSASSLAVGDVEQKTVTLDAAKIIYDDESGTASAEGGALLSYDDVRIAAERIDYDDESGKVIASSPHEKGVSISNKGYTLRGETLEYDIKADEGVLKGAKSSVAVEETTVFVRGENLEVIPYGTAVEKGLISGKSTIDGQYVVKWDDVSLTTCTLEHPHYRFEAKRFIFTPGRRVVVKKPRIYLGDVHIFTYPFDYVINVKRTQRLKSMFLPKLGYSESRGFGVGISGPFTWDTGNLTFDVSYWGKIGFEGEISIEQKIWNDFLVGGNVEYTWDREWDKKITRPSAFLRKDGKIWFSEIKWSQNKYIESQKDAEIQYRGLLDTRPEFSVGTHWQALGLGNNSSWYRILAAWGEYRETMLWFDRTDVVRDWQGRAKFSVENYGEGSGNIAPFWGATASTMLYNSNTRQDIYSATVGFRYGLGGMNAGSAYKRTWVRGSSTMFWDTELEDEKIYQMLDIPIGKYFTIGFWGGYDMRASFIEELNYSLKYQNDCMVWELAYRNDRNADGENKFFLRAGLLGTSFNFESEGAKNPFHRPSDLPK